MDGQWRPDIVIGIDFGMTCTGVAWSMGPDWPRPTTMQHWPGKLAYELRNKVDTILAYDRATGRLANWGFLCNEDDERLDFEEMFKPYLDKSFQEYNPDAPTAEDARRYYEDYLRSLYQHIMSKFSDQFPNFSKKRIEFVFSAPVSWLRNGATIHSIESIIHKAGFGHLENERASVSLSEAEAAAVYAAKQAMSKGDVVLVVDAGGSTTDLSVLKVEKATKTVMELSALTFDEGEWVGSSMIDFRMKSILQSRLEKLRGHFQGTAEGVAARMIKEKFLTHKCSFGDPSFDTPKFYFPVPGLPLGWDYPEAGVEDSKLVVTREEMRALFDEKIDKICALIDKLIRRVNESHSRESIDYMILSGGLGSSRYVQSRLKSRYETGAARVLPGCENLKLLVADEPQLAVVHGLVMSLTQSYLGGPSICARRCSPVSYGVVSREVYDPKRHQGEDLVKDPYDKKRWAEQQIIWMIKQGDVIGVDHVIRQPYRMKLPMGREEQTWKTRIVMSKLPRSQLPNSLRLPGAQQVCAVEAKLRRGDATRKNQHWWNLSKEYSIAEFEVRTMCGTGLKFEIWKNGTRSEPHEQIEVHWEDADGILPPATQEVADTIFPV